MHEQVANWRKKIGRHQEKQKVLLPTAHNRTSHESSTLLQSLIQKSKKLTPTQKIIIVILILVIAGVSIALTKEFLSATKKNKWPNSLPPGRKLLKTGGGSKVHEMCTMSTAMTEHTNCAMESLSNSNFFKKTRKISKPINTQIFTEMVLRKKLEEKITIHLSAIPEGYFADELSLKKDIIDYFIAQCDYQLLYFINTPVTMQLTDVIDEKKDFVYGRYEGLTNIIKIKIPICKNIVAAKNSLFPFDSILRYLRHEGWHAITAAINSNSECDPIKKINQNISSNKVLSLPVLLNNPKETEETIVKGDTRLHAKLTKLIERKNKVGFNRLSKPDQAQFNRYQQKFSNYTPRRDIAIFDKKALQDLEQQGVLKEIASGKPYKVTKADSTLPLFIDEIHYQYDPIQGEIIVGSGYHLSDPNDKLAAIIVDTQWRIERVPKLYDDKLKTSSNAYALKITELDSYLKEMGSEVTEEFYEEWRQRRFMEEYESPCQVALAAS